MKFSISSTDLLKHLQITAGAISNNPVLPILEDFLFDIQGNDMYITGSSLETTITTKADVRSDKNGKIAIPARILMDTLKALPTQPITFNVDEETNNIELTSSYGKYKLAGENGDDFPETPAEENTESVSTSQSGLLSAINNTLFATSNDELRLAMTGVFFEIDFNKIKLIATDAHKLVKHTILDVTGEVSTSFIVPKKSLQLLKGALGETDNVSISFNNTNAFFTIGETKLICRLIDKKYPDYNAVIPVDNPNKLMVNKNDLLSSLKRIAIYANKTTNQVILNINDLSIKISAQDLDFSNEANEEIECTYEGEDMTIAFNAKFIVEMLAVLDTDEVVLNMSKPNSAGILTPIKQKEGEDVFMLVMPVMLSN